MKLNISKRKWWVVSSIAILIALIPIVITTFELLSTGAESVVFLGNYPASIGVLILSYYALLIILGVFWFVKQVVHYFKLKSELAKAELQHLKSQVNPHFFFNMLNNLYGSIDKDPEKAKNLILKLSEMMRYSIYEGENEWVTIHEEMDYIQTFIDLHKMRYHKNVDVRMVCDIDDPDFKLMPLMFINLIENAFKHGVENLRKDAFVHIDLSLKENILDFTVQNNFDYTSSDQKNGIGLKNLIRRLQLVYPKRHLLSFEIRNDIYQATLNIQPE